MEAHRRTKRDENEWSDSNNPTQQMETNNKIQKPNWDYTAEELNATRAEFTLAADLPCWHDTHQDTSRKAQACPWIPHQVRGCSL